MGRIRTICRFLRGVNGVDTHGLSKMREASKKLEDAMSSEDGQSGPKSNAEWNESAIEDSGLRQGVSGVQPESWEKEALEP